MITGISDIAILVVLAAALSTLAHIFRQPIVLAYLATGAIISMFHFLDLGDYGGLGFFSDLGIMFLLFLIGLEINYSSLRHAGRTSVIVGIGQLVITFGLGFILALAFHLSTVSAAYISIALTFSSTVIVVKILSEKKDLNSLYGKISLGFLLVQDCIAILLLVALSSFQNGSSGDIVSRVFSVLLIGLGLFALMFYLGRKILPSVLDLFARSQELLFLVTLAWLFGVATLASKLGFSIEIGGLLAGLSLANSSERLQIAYRIRPLRDFFILVFFAILGSSVVTSSYAGLGWPILVFSVFVLIGNPLVVLCLMGFMGYRLRTSFMAGVTVAQVSEFSLVLMALGLKIGHVQQADVALVTAVGVITITLSNYLIIHGERLFAHLAPYLRFFERRHTSEHHLPSHEIKKSIILVGAHRTGQSIALRVPKSNLAVIDFDPEVIERLKHHGYECLFGDIADEEIYGSINFNFVKLMISTTPSLDDNLAVLRLAKQLKKQKKYRFHVIVRAKNEREVELLYQAGADYVLLPHLTAGEYLGQAVAKETRFDFLKKMKEKDLKMIKRETSLAHA